MGWQWHQLDQMQIICTSFREITVLAPHPSIFYCPDSLSDTQPTALKQTRQYDVDLLVCHCQFIVSTMRTLLNKFYIMLKSVRLYK